MSFQAKRLTLTALSAILLLALACSVRLEADDARPNILMIAVDDLNYYLGELLEQEGHFLSKAYPDPETRASLRQRLTPNIDRLARQGTHFRRAYSPQALCGPSRTAALTGIPPHISGYDEHSRHFRHFETLKDALTLPQYLRQEGYFTTGLGKIFHKPSLNFQNGEVQDWPDLRYSWDAWIERQAGMGGPGPHGYRASPYSPENGNFTYGVNALPAEQSWDYLNTAFVTELLTAGEASVTDMHGTTRHIELPQNQPFFVALGLFAPHLPWNANQRFYDLFPTEEMTGVNQDLLEWVEADIEDLPQFAIDAYIPGPHHPQYRPYRDFDRILEIGAAQGDAYEGWRRCIQAYLAATAYADYCLGQLIEAIESGPRADDTIVMLWGDHGWNLGDKRRYRKHALWESANHTTFIIKDPRRPSPEGGAVSDRLVSLQDIYPTVTNLAGLPRPDHIHGRDLTPLLENPDAPFDERVLMSMEEGNNTLHVPGWRYTRYADGSQELYSFDDDPFEYRNLASHPAMAQQLEQMDAALDEALAWGPDDF